MKFFIFSYAGLHWWFTIFAATTFLAKVNLDVLGMFKIRYLTEQLYKKKCSLILSMWLGINLPFALYYMSQIQGFR